MVRSPVGLVPLAGKNFQCLIAERLQGPALSPIVLAHSIARLIVKVHIETVAHSDKDLSCADPQAVFTLLHRQIHRLPFFTLYGFGVLLPALQATKNIYDPGSDHPNPGLAPFKRQCDLLP